MKHLCNKMKPLYINLKLLNKSKVINKSANVVSNKNTEN